MADAKKRAASGPVSGAAEAQASSVSELLSVAELEASTANFESAARTYRRALDLATAPLDRARALRGIGSCLEESGRWTEALASFDDAALAAQESEDATELGRIRVKQGKVHLQKGALDTAIRLGTEALELIDIAADPSHRGFALLLLGTTFNRNGDLSRSIEYFEQALTAFKNAGDIRSLAKAYNNLGLTYKQRCQWSRALEYLQVASSLKAIEGEYAEQRSGLQNLGIVHFRMSQWDRARECFSESERLSREVNDPVRLLRALIGIAGVDLVQRRWEPALESLEQALELCSEEQYPRETGLTYMALGQLHQSRGDFPRARRCLEVAWRKAVEISQESDLICQLLRLRGELALAEKQMDSAENLTRRAVELSQRVGDSLEHALAHIALGRVLLARKDKSGYDSIGRGQSLLREAGSGFPLAQALAHEGRLRLERNDDLDRAEIALKEALAVLQPLSLHEFETELLTLLARIAIRRDQLDLAADTLERARDTIENDAATDIRDLLAETQKDLEARLVETSVLNLGAFRTAGRLEEVVDSQRPYPQKLNDVLHILSQAVEADGAALIFLGSTLPSVTSQIGSAPAQVLASVLRTARPERPEMILHARTAARAPWNEITGAREATSMMVIPISGNGTPAFLYLDRIESRGRGAFGPSHLNLCLALVPQLESLAARAGLEASQAVEEDSLKRRTFLADVVTQNPEMLEILKLVEKVNRTDLTVLLQGETGTGKTLIARAIHMSSDRSGGAFVTVDCAALPENLLESELFGYTKGAFTGASGDKKGLFEEADGGTIFLDEIGKAGLGVQRRLLHLLDKGEVRPVGSTSYRKLNVRVICATSKQDLLSSHEDGPFIKDLYYRLNDIIIRVPSLRERLEDIPLLAEYFLENFLAHTGRESAGFSRSAVQRLVRYTWPGNVRELEKVVRRAAILSEEGSSIGADLFPREVLDATEDSPSANGSGEADLRASVEDVERRLVLDALTKHQWNKTRAAQELGLSRKGLKNKIVRYGLSSLQP